VTEGKVEVEVKTPEELVSEGRLSEDDVLCTILEWYKNTVVLIFSSESAAARYVIDVLHPKIGYEKLKSIFVIAVSRKEALANNFLLSLLGFKKKYNSETWLLFKKDGYESIIKPVMEKS
jgi:hypothetical protein